MIAVETEALEPGRVLLGHVRRGGADLSFAQVFAAWRHDAEVRTAFTAALAAAPFAGFFWETPPFTRATAAEPFQFVLVDAPALARMAPERNAFAAELAAGGVVVFPNLGGDAALVSLAAESGAPPDVYAHLAAFSRGAPADQQHALWQTVGTAVWERLSDAPLWLSTSGLGVAWLHVRLDTRPKYYTHAPYRRRPRGC